MRWTNWLIQAAERRGNWPKAVQSMIWKGWRLTFMGHLLEAETTLVRALSLREYVTPKEEVSLYRFLGSLSIRKGDIDKAHEWLKQAMESLQHVDKEDRERERDATGLTYWQGVAYFEEQNYDQAHMLFRQVLDQGKAIGWQRAIIYAQNWLADIAIAQGNLDEAERLLQTGLPVAERNKDKRRTACYKRSFALLARARGAVDEMRRWATEAHDGFERLGMQLEAQEMYDLEHG